jgi:hut operon positive regulator
MPENLEKQLSLGRATMYLAKTEDRQKEDQEKEKLLAMGYSVVATEVTGTLAEFKQKIIKNTVTAAIKTKVIEDIPKGHHGLVHAITEAMQGVLISHLANPSMKVKVSVVSDGDWVAVGIFGVAALSISTNHERCGLGVMHL